MQSLVKAKNIEQLIKYCNKVGWTVSIQQIRINGEYQWSAVVQDPANGYRCVGISLERHDSAYKAVKECLDNIVKEIAEENENPG